MILNKFMFIIKLDLTIMSHLLTFSDEATQSLDFRSS